MTSVEFFYDFVCPYAYLAHARIELMCAEHDAALVHRPILLGGVFRALGTADQPMATAPAAKRALGELDIQRSAARAGMPIVRPDGHPRRTVLALRATLAADLPDRPKATRALFRAYWAHGYDLEQPAVVEHALSEAGLDGHALVGRATGEAVKLALREATDAAVAAGVFGVPSFRVENARGTQLFWGQDRMTFVDKALDGWFVPLPDHLAGVIAVPRGAA